MSEHMQRELQYSGTEQTNRLAGDSERDRDADSSLRLRGHRTRRDERLA